MLSIMSRRANPIVLSAQERSILDTWVRGRILPVRLVQRAQIIRMAADGVLSQDIARNLGVSRPTVQLWRQRFLALRLPGLEKDAPRPGRIPRIAPRKIKALVEATLHTKPANATHWSTRTMAKAQGVSEATVRRIWTQHGLPMKKGRCGTMTHDYKRNGTTTLFAALSMLDGRVIGDCMPRHRHQEFIR